MLRIFSVTCVVVLLLSGCAQFNDVSDHGMILRQKISEGCTFTANIVAVFSDASYSFTVNCMVNSVGEMDFAVVHPDSISGITGKVSAAGGSITFDETVLAFPLLADGEISPVCAPWLCVRSMMGGYLRSSGIDGEQVRLTIDDSFSGENLQTDIWLAANETPEYGEILWNGRKVLSVHFENFHFV